MPPTQDDSTTPAAEPQTPLTNPSPMPSSPIPTPPQAQDEEDPAIVAPATNTIQSTNNEEPMPATPGAAPTNSDPEADGYYGEAEPETDELDLQFLDEEKADDPTRDLPKAP